MAGKMKRQHNTGLNLKGKSLKDVAHLFARNKVSWLEVAPTFCNADEDGKDLSHLAVTYQRTRGIIAAYRLLQAQRPEFLKNPGTGPLPVPSTLAYLRFIHKKAVGTDKEKVFGEILDGVIDGTVKEPQIRILAKQAKNSDEPNLATPESLAVTSARDVVSKKPKLTSAEKSRGDVDSISALENVLKIVDFVLVQALERNSYTQLRSLLGQKCMHLSARLNCVGDKEFHKLWKERKEGVRA